MADLVHLDNVVRPDLNSTAWQEGWSEIEDFDWSAQETPGGFEKKTLAECQLAVEVDGANDNENAGSRLPEEGVGQADHVTNHVSGGLEADPGFLTSTTDVGETVHIAEQGQAHETDLVRPVAGPQVQTEETNEFLPCGERFELPIITAAAVNAARSSLMAEVHPADQGHVVMPEPASASMGLQHKVNVDVDAEMDVHSVNESVIEQESTVVPLLNATAPNAVHSTTPLAGHTPMDEGLEAFPRQTDQTQSIVSCEDAPSRHEGSFLYPSRRNTPRLRSRDSTPRLDRTPDRANRRDRRTRRDDLKAEMRDEESPHAPTPTIRPFALNTERRPSSVVENVDSRRNDDHIFWNPKSHGNSPSAFGSPRLQSMLNAAREAKTSRESSPSKRVREAAVNRPSLDQAAMGNGASGDAGDRSSPDVLLSEATEQLKKNTVKKTRGRAKQAKPKEAKPETNRASSRLKQTNGQSEQEVVAAAAGWRVSSIPQKRKASKSSGADPVVDSAHDDEEIAKPRAMKEKVKRDSASLNHEAENEESSELSSSDEADVPPTIGGVRVPSSGKPAGGIAQRREPQHDSVTERAALQALAPQDPKPPDGGAFHGGHKISKREAQALLKAAGNEISGSKAPRTRRQKQAQEDAQPDAKAAVRRRRSGK